MAFPFAGLKKQLNKANQYMSERITGVEGTKLNNEFQDMERHTDLVSVWQNFVFIFVTRTK
jgi:hypothetical protein